MMDQLENDLVQKEQSLKEDYKRYEKVIQEKNYQIANWETNYLKMEQEVSQIAK